MSKTPSVNKPKAGDGLSRKARGAQAATLGSKYEGGGKYLSEGRWSRNTEGSAGNKTSAGKQIARAGLVVTRHPTDWGPVTDSKTVLALKRGVFGVIDDRVVVEKAREGLPFAEFERLARLLELTLSEQAGLLSITQRTMARRIAERGTLHALESERLVLLQKLAEYGVEVFEDAGKFNRWLRRPLPLLGGKSPLQYLDMSTGFVVVEQVLGRLAHGVYS